MHTVFSQSGVIPYRFNPDGKLEVLLITSRDSGRWVIPKGNLWKGHTAAESAEREAQEEAGVVGTLDNEPIGFYTHRKPAKNVLNVPIVVQVFALRANKIKKTWPEKAERSRQWMSAQKASKRVQEHGLALLILALAERLLVGEIRPRDVGFANDERTTVSD